MKSVLNVNVGDEEEENVIDDIDDRYISSDDSDDSSEEVCYCIIESIYHILSKSAQIRPHGAAQHRATPLFLKCI